MNKPTKEFLDLHYNTLGKSCQAIGELCGCSRMTISKWLTQYGFLIRKNNRMGRPNLKIKDLSHFIGRTFGKLEIIGFEKLGLICKCECGFVKTLRPNRLLRKVGNETSCGCSHGKQGMDSCRWKGGRYVSGLYLCSVRRRAAKKKILFEIGPDDVDQLLIKQDWKCAITGLPISFSDKTASVDRIDSSKGYTKDNIQLLHKVINVMKHDHTQDEFIRWCTLVVDTQRVRLDI